MSRWRPHRLGVGPSLFAALAVLGVTLSARPLFAPNDWIRPTTTIVLAVMTAGWVARALTQIPVLVAAVQVLTSAWVTVNVLLRPTTTWTLPSPRTWPVAWEQLRSAREAVLGSAAPVPLEPGLVLAFVLIVAALAIVVDLLAVTLAMPAAAGLPLLGVYVAAAANSGTGLSVWSFLLPALGWLGLVGHDGLGRLRRWGGTVARPEGGLKGRLPRDRDLTGSMLTLARTLGALGIVAAVFLPGLIPHFPPTFVADGLGRASNARGGSGGSGLLGTTLDVSRNLREQSEATVLTYSTTVNSPPPLRVDVLTDFSNGIWQPSTAGRVGPNGRLPGLAQALSIDPTSGLPPVVSGTSTINDNVLKRPQLAIPGTATALDLPSGTWMVDANGVPRLLEPQASYRVAWQELAPKAGTFGQSAGSYPGTAAALAIDPEAEPMLTEVLAEIAPARLSPAETARAIQNYLRSSRFTYSVNLDPVVDALPDGRSVSTDPVTQFLISRRGYCVQFATAMALMARERGIPARIGIGFLPGSLNRSTWTVKGKDAHAWPELWFADTGWLRFEPTPGVRSGVAPEWTLTPVTTNPSASATVASPRAATERPDPVAPNNPTATSNNGVFTQIWAWVSEHALVLTAGLFGLLAVFAVPIGGAFARRRAVRRALDDAERVEVLWQSMLARLSDVGLEPGRGDTPRQAAAHLDQQAHLDAPAQVALGSVVAMLERARYAPHPDPDLPALDEAARLVVVTAQRRRRRLTRLRARLWPSEGLAAWSALTQGIGIGARALSRRMPWAWLTLRARRPRRTPR